MRITTWNINSVRQRLEHLVDFLKEAEPNVLCLQEIKTQDEGFPRSEIEAAGYVSTVRGQKGFNGVAILTKIDVEPDILRSLPGDESDEQARYLEAVVAAGQQTVRVASIYLPNGNPLGADKFSYKLAWMERLRRHAAGLLAAEEIVVLAGDYNVIPEPRDARFPQNWMEDALFQPESRAAYRSILNLGYTDALRATSDADGLYTFWDYQAGAWQKNNGIRIDHLLLSPRAADRLLGVTIHKDMRARDKPSDHVPISVDIDL